MRQLRGGPQFAEFASAFVHEAATLMPLRDLALDVKPVALPADVARFIREAEGGKSPAEGAAVGGTGFDSAREAARVNQAFTYQQIADESMCAH